MPHIYITGDKHGDYTLVEQFCLRWNTSKDDLLIVLGDNGVNYWGPHSDKRLKRRLASLPITFFMVKGNHDQRPSFKTYRKIMSAHPLVSGVVLAEEAYPNLMFSEMYGAYDFHPCGKDDIRAYVLGGAYSADKWYRLDMQAMGHTAYRWFPDEQMTEKEMHDAYLTMKIDACKASLPVILSHTCPFKYIPRDMFLSQIDQSTVDDTMERWMDLVEGDIPYAKWYCGHWHTDRSVDKIRFMYHDIIELVV